MTKALIKILETDPHPTLRNLLTRVSHELHKLYFQLHRHAVDYRKDIKELNQKRVAKGLEPLRAPSFMPEMDNFQDPEMSSHRPLAKDARWDP